MVAHVVDGCQPHDEHDPHGHEEDAQRERDGEGVERGVVIEMDPHLRREGLQAGVERGGRGHDEAEQRGVERLDVVEMDQVGLVLADAPQQVGGRYDGDDNEEHDDVGVGEGRYELGDGVVGHDAWQHARLSGPPKLGVVVAQLHPNGVDLVGGHHAYVGHDEVVALAHGERVGLHAAQILLGHLPQEGEAVGLHDEVVVVGVMVGGEERQRVDLPLAILVSGMGAVMGHVARRQQRREHEGADQEQEVEGVCKGSSHKHFISHKQPSDRLCNRTPNGSGGHRQGAT